MPIIDPALQYSLLKTSGKPYACSELFITQLKIASLSINRNINSIKAHNLFRKDLIENIKTIKYIFDRNNISIHENSFLTNYFHFLYEYIHDTSKKKYLKEKDKEYICFNQDHHLFYYKRPGLHGLGSWYFTDSSLAIFVCYDLNTFKDKDSDEIRQRLGLLNLEIDVLIASGLTLALVVQFNPEITDIAKDFIEYSLKDHPFSEIHFNLEFSSLVTEKKNMKKY